MPIVSEETAFDIAQGAAGPFYSIDAADKPAGQVQGVPQKIVRFTDQRGRPRYGLTPEGHPFPDKYEQVTDFIRDPEVFWEA